MEWVAPAYIALLVATIPLGMAMFVLTVRRQRIPGSLPLMMIFLLFVIWPIFILGEIFAPSIDTKLLFFDLRTTASVLLPVLWMVMTVEVYRQEFWRRNGWLIALLIFPVTVAAIGFSGHPLSRVSVEIGYAYGLRVLFVERGAWAILEVAYGYTLVLIGIGFIIDLIRRTLPSYRYPSGVLIAGILLTIGATLFDLMGLNPLVPLPAMTLVFVPVTLCFFWGVSRNQMLDVLPVARDRVLDAVADAVLVINRKGKIVDLNRAARDLFARVLPDTNPLGVPLAQALAKWPEWQAAASEAKPQFEVARKGATGLEMFEVAVTTLNTPHGTLLGQILLINDVTAQKQAFELMAERERIQVLQEFIRHASHDLRTPMSVINSSAYLMKRLAEKQIENLAALHPRLPQVYATIIEEAIDMTGKIRDRSVAADDAAKRLWRILSGMIELAEMETAGALERQPLDCNQIIEVIVTGRRGDSERRGIDLTATFGELPQISADEKRLHRAFDAVLLNAIQYTRRGGKVSVLTEISDTGICVAVTDTGIGISAEDLPRIYERFFRADPARSIETGGAGLGLPLAKSIIEAHGGSIAVESTVGVGSTFRVNLPLA